MNFKLKEWLKLYENIYERGHKYKNSLPTCDVFNKMIPPIAPLTEQEQLQLQDEIKILVRRCSKYMDRCKMYMPSPVWKYHRDDSSTHASSINFRYGHLYSVSKY